MIAGSLGVTLIVGGVSICTIGLAVILVLLAPKPEDPNLLRQAIVDQGEELGWCGHDTSGGELTLTLVTHSAGFRHVAISGATVEPRVAQCVADSVLALSVPGVATSAQFTVRLDPSRVPPR